MIYLNLKDQKNYELFISNINNLLIDNKKDYCHIQYFLILINMQKI